MKKEKEHKSAKKYQTAIIMIVCIILVNVAMWAYFDMVLFPSEEFWTPFKFAGLVNIALAGILSLVTWDET